MSDSHNHLLRMKRRLRASQENMSPMDKVDLLEKTLSVFRAEVDMKLKLIQQILTTRNEQVSVQKKLLDREQTLYNTLLSHWKNTPKLATTGLSVDFSALDFFGGEGESEDNHSDPDYFEGDELSHEPSRKKSRSSLRRQRRRQRTSNKTAKQNPASNSNDENAEDENENNFAKDSMPTEWEGLDTPPDPPVQVQMKNEAYDEDEDLNNFNEFSTQESIDQETASWNWDPSTNQSNPGSRSSELDSDGNGTTPNEPASCSNLNNRKKPKSSPKYTKTSTAAKHYIEELVKENSDRLTENPLQFVTSQTGAKLLVVNGYVFRKSSEYNDSIYWRCIQRNVKCSARCTTIGNQVVDKHGFHNHTSDYCCDGTRRRAYSLTASTDQ